MGGAISLASSKRGPDYPRVLIGYRHRCVVEAAPLPKLIEAQIGGFIDYYNNRRYHESLMNLTPADVYFGRGSQILSERERIKHLTIQNRRLHNQLTAT